MEYVVHISIFPLLWYLVWVWWKLQNDSHFKRYFKTNNFRNFDSLKISSKCWILYQHLSAVALYDRQIVYFLQSRFLFTTISWDKLCFKIYFPEEMKIFVCYCNYIEYSNWILPWKSKIDLWTLSNYTPINMYVIHHCTNVL